MPFSKGNIRFTLLVIGLVCLFATAVSGMAAVAYSKNPNSTPLLTAIISFCSIQILQLISLLRQEQNAKTQTSEIVKTRHDIKNDLTPVSLVAKEALSKDSMPCTREELKVVIREVLLEGGFTFNGLASEKPQSG